MLSGRQGRAIAQALMGSARSQGLLPGVAVMAFVLFLLNGGHMILDHHTHRWVQSFTGKWTVQVFRALEESPEQTGARVRQVTEILREHQGVEAFTVVPQEALRQRIKTWLGPAVLDVEAPLPVVVEVRLAPGVAPDPRALEARLQKQAGSMRLNTHQIWLEKVLALSVLLQWIGWAVYVLLVLATTIATTLALKGKLAQQHESIHLLHLMGAETHALIYHFCRVLLIPGLGGYALGLMAAALVMLALVPHPPTVFWYDPLRFVIPPCLLVGLVTLSTHRAVTRTVESFRFQGRNPTSIAPGSFAPEGVPAPPA